MSRRVREEFRFDFGGIPLPSCHPHHPPSSSSSSSSSALPALPTVAILPTPTPRFSMPPENMTTNDHQLLGEYKNEFHTVKITYNHTKVDGVIYKHTLINPFVLSIGSEVGHPRYLIRDTPDKLVMLGKTVSEYKKLGPVLEKKCNFAFNSVKNAFLFLSAMDGSSTLEFRENSVGTESIELVNPLTCRTNTGWFFVDLRKFVVCQVTGTTVHTYDVVDMDDRVRTLIQASEYYISDRLNEL